VGPRRRRLARRRRVDADAAAGSAPSTATVTVAVPGDLHGPSDTAKAYGKAIGPLMLPV
jgi:hypothetical protein